MRLIDDTDWTDITPTYPSPLDPIADIFGVIAAGLLLTVAFMSALIFMLRPTNEKAGPLLLHLAAVLLSLFVAVLRMEWLAFLFTVLILPLFIGIRWTYRRIADRYPY